MFLLKVFIHSALISLVAAAYQGFNYGATFSDETAKTLQDFTNDFTAAQSLPGTSSAFQSARLFTMIQAGTPDSVTEAIQAAIDTDTTLLLGLWASAGPVQFSVELSALENAIKTYGTDLVSLVVGIVVGSEDLYRISPLDTDSQAGLGAGPVDVVAYINQTRSIIANTTGSNIPIGHADTWTAWVNSSNYAVIAACDFLGTDAYPYFQNQEANSIDVASTLFFDAYNATVLVSEGKPVWITETGFPVSGPTENQAVPSLDNARTYWNQVGCTVFGQISTWWYTLQDSVPDTPSPSFGIVGSNLSVPLYDLSCGAAAVSSSTTSTSTSTSTTTSAAQSSTSAPPPSSTPPSSSPSACPTSLAGPFEFPHLIIPVNQSQPDEAAGTSYDGQFGPSISSIFNFDITEIDKTCSLVFLFPDQSQMPSSWFTLTGSGGINIARLTGPASTATTWSSAPTVAELLGSVAAFSPGNSYLIATFPCPGGQTIGVEIAATGSLSLEYFQDSAAPGIGLYITVC